MLQNLGVIKHACVHHFSDASEKSYGNIFYLRRDDNNDNVKRSFLLGKTKLAPLKTLTTPRLKLCAATVSIRLENLCKELDLACQLEPSVFWTNSTAVLHHINSEKGVFQTFVAYRIHVFAIILNLDNGVMCQPILTLLILTHASKGLGID